MGSNGFKMTGGGASDRDFSFNVRQFQILDREASRFNFELYA